MEIAEQDSMMKMEMELDGHSMKDSFFFSKRTTNLLIQGWTVVTDNQFILVLLCLFFVAVFMEAGRRITREVIKKILEIDTQLNSKSVSTVNAVTFTPLLPSDNDPSQAADDANDSNRASQSTNNETTKEMSNELSPYRTPKKVNKVWRMNQDGFLQLSTNTNLSHDEEVEVTDPTSSQMTPAKNLKRNYSLDMGINRYDEPSDRLHQSTSHQDKLKLVSVPERNRLRFKRLAMHSLVCVIHVCQVILGYLLMLVIMSFNVWFISSIVTGAAVGYALFSWDRIRLKTSSSAYSRVTGVESSV